MHVILHTDLMVYGQWYCPPASSITVSCNSMRLLTVWLRPSRFLMRGGGQLCQKLEINTETLKQECGHHHHYHVLMMIILNMYVNRPVRGYSALVSPTCGGGGGRLRGVGK